MLQAPLFLPIGAFGIYSSVHFLRGKSAKPLLTALTLGAMIDVVGFIGLPLYHANFDDDATLIAKAPAKPSDDSSEPSTSSAIDNETGRSVQDRLDYTQLNLGISLLIAYGVISIYTLSISVNRHQRR